MKPICVPCQRFYRQKKTGFYFTEGAPLGSGVEPGVTTPELWRPYKLWSGDLWECKGCGSQILSGFGSQPIRVQHEHDFERMIESLGARRFQVNDC